MRTVFVGGVQNSLVCLEALTEVEPEILAIFTYPKSFKKKFSDWTDLAPVAQKSNSKLYRTRNINLELAKIRYLRPEVIYVCGWSQMLSSDIIKIPTKYCVGLHPTLLPKNRGRAPIAWTIIKGLKKSGVTLFNIDEGTDSGAILGQMGFEVSVDENVASLMSKIATVSAELVKKVHLSIQAGTIKPKPQSEKLANYWSRRTPQMGLIDWNQSAQAIVKFINGLSRPYPGGFAYANRKKIFFWKAKALTDKLNMPPGTIGQILPNRAFTVSTSKSALMVEDWTSGENKKPTNILRSGLKLKGANDLRRIAIVTGSRAEWGLLNPVAKSIQSHKNLELKVIAAAMHLSAEFGFTVKEIEKDFDIAALVKMLPVGDSGKAMAQAIGKGVIGFAETFNNLRPDVLVILGDRSEPFAAAIAAAHMGIAIAHVHGGDSLRAGLDEYARYAITKFSHFHFAATKKSARRIIKLGEISENVYVVGAPGLDTILGQELPTRELLEKKLKIKLKKKYILVIQHPVTTQVHLAAEQIATTLAAVKELDMQVIVIYPNSDTGSRAMIKVIEKFHSHDNFHIYKSLPHKVYLGLLREAAVLVGNSSSGIIESSSFKIPVINIGIRQEGRERSSNVIDVSYNKLEIKRAVNIALHDKNLIAKIARCRNPYGNGTAGKKIAEILSKIELDDKLLQKKITY